MSGTIHQRLNDLIADFPKTFDSYPQPPAVAHYLRILKALQKQIPSRPISHKHFICAPISENAKDLLKLMESSTHPYYEQRLVAMLMEVCRIHNLRSTLDLAPKLILKSTKLVAPCPEFYRFVKFVENAHPKLAFFNWNNQIPLSSLIAFTKAQEATLVCNAFFTRLYADRLRMHQLDLLIMQSCLASGAIPVSNESIELIKLLNISNHTAVAILTGIHTAEQYELERLCSAVRKPKR